MTDEEISKAFMKMLKTKTLWKPMESENGSAWFGGKSHHPIAEYLPDGTLDKHDFRDIDFLVVGWQARYNK